MHKHQLLRTFLLSTVFALLAVFLMAPVTSAHTAASAQRAVTAISQIPAVPNVNIVRANGRSVFSATTIHCKARGLDINKPCFTITNKTDKDQQVVFKGRVIVTIPAGRVGNISVSNAGLGFVSLHANPQAILTVIAS